MHGLLNLKSLKTDQILDILSLASSIKGGRSLSYSGKRMATLFYENSTRTHNSFLMAMMKLGIQFADINVAGSSVSKG